MKEKGGLPPRLKALEDLIAQVSKAHPVDDVATETRIPPRNRRQLVVGIDQLIPFPDHPFRLYTGERLDDMVESIKANGILAPIIVRTVGNSMQILAGHNRVNAAKLAGLDTVPVLGLGTITDEEAWVYVIETNLMQRSFADMAPSEKAAVISAHHSKLFSQGKRNDIINELRMLENSKGDNGYVTSPTEWEKLHSGKKAGEMYSLKKSQVAKYLRINMMVPALKLRLDNDELTIVNAVTLSFLIETEQTLVDKHMSINGFTVDTKKAMTLRAYSSSGKLDDDTVFLILSGEIGRKPKPNRTPTVKVSKAAYAKYFRPNQTAKEIQDTVEKALEYYFTNH